MSGLTVIKAYAFSNCSNLTNIEIPSTVIGIGEDAFKYCTNLEKITIKKGSTLSANSEGYPWGADESKITFEK